MMIFDSFVTQTSAESFADAVQVAFGLQATVYDSQDESDRHDPFPFQLNPPIVLVERTEFQIEEQVGRLVAEFRGRYAGT